MLETSFIERTMCEVIETEPLIMFYDYVKQGRLKVGQTIMLAEIEEGGSPRNIQMITVGNCTPNTMPDDLPELGWKFWDPIMNLFVIEVSAFDRTMF